MVVVSMLRSRDIAGVNRELDRAIVFWIDGFRKIVKATTASETVGETRTSFVSLADLGVVFIWTLMCSLFWLGLLTLSVGRTWILEG